MIRDCNNEHDGVGGGGGTTKAPSSICTSTFTFRWRRVGAQEGPQAIISKLNHHLLLLLTNWSK